MNKMLVLAAVLAFVGVTQAVMDRSGHRNNFLTDDYDESDSYHGLDDDDHYHGDMFGKGGKIYPGRGSHYDDDHYEDDEYQGRGRGKFGKDGFGQGGRVGGGFFSGNDDGIFGGRGQGHGGRFYSENDDDFYGGSHDDPFFARAGSAGRQNAFFSNSDRLRDRAKASARDQESAKLAAGQSNKDQFAARNRKAGENFFKADNKEMLSANHDISSNKNFKLQLVDQKSHNEHSDVGMKKGQAVAKGDRFKVDQGVAKSKFDDMTVKAAANKEHDSKIAKELEAEKETAAKKDSVVEEAEEVGTD